MGFIRSLINAKVGFRLLVAVDVLLFGVVAMFMLAKLKKPPVEAQPPKPVIRVEVKKVVPEDVPVYITAYGNVTALKSVRVAPEVSGKVIQLNPQLIAGRFVEEDDVLFEIDKRDYLAVYKDARATLARISNTIERLQEEEKIAQFRLKTLVRNRDLALAEFERIKKLFEVNKIGTQSQVDTAERSYNAAVDQLTQMKQVVQTYPLQIKEAHYQLESAKASVFRAATNLRRCAVRAPFRSRIREVAVEVGQYVAPGQGLVQLVDDRVLELAVPIDSVDARRWLLFEKRPEKKGRQWFSALKPVPVRVRWTEDENGHQWQGRLHRVIGYDRQTRTLTVAVRVENRSDRSASGSLPLVEGMFCEVTIPGKTMKRVFRLPRRAVSFRNTLFLAEQGKLKTVPVEVVRIQGDEVFVRDGLKPDDAVITTRLSNPLENSQLEILNQR